MSADITNELPPNPISHCGADITCAVGNAETESVRYSEFFSEAVELDMTCSG